MLQALRAMVLVTGAFADGEIRTGGVPNLAVGAQIEASSSAGLVGAKYGIDSAIDGDRRTWWCSQSRSTFPVWVTLTLAAPAEIDTIAFVQTGTNAHIYSNWKSLRVSFSDGSNLETQLEDQAAPVVIRFEPREVAWLRLEILEPHEREKHYVTLQQLMVFADPEQKVRVKMPPTVGWKDADVTPQGRDTHPCVYMTPDDVARARTRIQTDEWAKKWSESTRATADTWMAKDEAWFRSVIPKPGSAFAYGFTGCPICRARWGTWGGARCSFENPGYVTCMNGHVLPDDDHPDEGEGYTGPDGRIHYFVGSYNAWVTETLQFKVLQPLAFTYTLTGDERYAERVAFILDLLADIYPECDAGSWDYPSTPPSGRFARPWYQVARVLIHFTDWYDQIYTSASLDEPSVTEGLTRRENIEVNLLQNGATYCYKQSLKGRLHNGEADYIRGALAVGACLGIPWYIDWAYDGPYGILSQVRNNVDRDGRYFETSTGYADHTRSLYLTFAEPLINYRSEKYPNGVNLYDDAQFQSFYVLPQLSFNCAGKRPRFGDSGPDTAKEYLPDELTSNFDYRLAERLYARVSGDAEKAKFASLLGALTGGDIAGARNGRAEMPWMLFHAGDVPASAGELHPLIRRRIHESEFFGQKGIGILRAGTGPQAQSALIRFGPTLNHGHLDDLNLNYYALGYELTYDLGYGLGSTHTQVGWSKETASHNLVVVDETPQMRDGSGTGGSLHQFADLAGLQLMDVSSDASYVAQGVTTYRRLVAMIGEGENAYLVDIFRVVGGKQHDYLLHSLADSAEFAGVELGEAAEGSLAGTDVNWGALQLNDGDMDGYPNRPYWNPPPGNGLGFIMEPRRASSDDAWSASWELPDGESSFRLTVLGQPGTEVISAWAPGIYPHLPKTSVAVARREAAGEEPLASTFIGVMEPYGQAQAGTRYGSGTIATSATATGGEVKLISSIGVLLHKAGAVGDEMQWEFEVAETGEYVVGLEHYTSPSYGSVQVLIDGEPFGAEAIGTDPETRGTLTELGVRELAAGTHAAAVRAVGAGDGENHWFGVRGLWLTKPEEADPAESKPFVVGTERLTGDGDAETQPAGLVVTLDGDRQDVILSATGSFTGEGITASLQGAFAHVRLVGNEPREIHMIGAKEMALGDLRVTCGEAEFAGIAAKVDEAQATIETEAALPTDGRLNGQLILFESDSYSRNTPHRIARVEAIDGGSRIVLESPSLILGTGILEDDPQTETEFVSLLAHEYARSDSVPGTQFFSGKRIKGEGFETTLTQTEFGQLMRCHVESTEGMGAGDEFIICDVQIGDRFRIPTMARVSVGDDGALTGSGTTDVTVIRAGEEAGRVPATP